MEKAVTVSWRSVGTGSRISAGCSRQWVKAGVTPAGSSGSNVTISVDSHTESGLIKLAPLNSMDTKG